MQSLEELRIVYLDWENWTFLNAIKYQIVTKKLKKITTKKVFSH